MKDDAGSQFSTSYSHLSRWLPVLTLSASLQYFDVLGELIANGSNPMVRTEYLFAMRRKADKAGTLSSRQTNSCAENGAN